MEPSNIYAQKVTSLPDIYGGPKVKPAIEGYMGIAISNVAVPTQERKY